MTRKLKCSTTGNWVYCTEVRYQKLVQRYGGEAELQSKYVSRVGKRIQNYGGKVPEKFRNKIKCSICGTLHYISDERLKLLAKKTGGEDVARANYVSRVARRLLKAGKTVDEIKAMAAAGTLPLPVTVVPDAPAQSV